MAKTASPKPKSAVAGKGAAPAQKPKQAVVVIHGMGEQRPMETLRGFVAALCGVKPVEAERKGGHEPFHIIPEAAAGSNELARIRVSSAPVAHSDIRTDFYEYYYADLLGGTTLGHLKSWAQAVMFRWPHQVPKKLALLWATLWVVAGLLTWWIGREFDGKVFDRLIAFATSGLKPEAPGPSPVQQFLLMIAMAALAWRLLWMAGRHASNPETKPDESRTLDPKLSFAFAAALPVLIGIALWNALPWAELRWTPPEYTKGIWGVLTLAGDFFGQVWIKLLVAAFLWWAVTQFGVAYFGDVARYLRMSPDAIQSRKAIRDRGMALLTALQDKRAIENGMPTTRPEYDRIVIVAHSLGSIIGYDVMRILWARDNANANKALPAGAVAAMQKIVGLSGTVSGRAIVADTTGVFDRDAFIKLQREVSLHLCKEAHGWRISDFITLGSPLASADFLLARDWPRFMQAVGERSLPLCPPFHESNKSFLYTGGTIPGEAPHHAAMFSAVRWTSFHDPYHWPMNGDFIGGPVSDLFGQGAADIPVEIERKRFWFKSLFTHTQYWNQDVEAKTVDDTKLPPDLSGPGKSTQEVLAILRKLIWHVEETAGGGS